MREAEDEDSKYITFKREDFVEAVGRLLGPHELEDGVPVGLLKIQLDDAVVIRRQDRFASPCLATYAACIAIAYHMTDDQNIKKQLTHISDYFERQAQLAAEEGHKLPDL